jgi:hypothetical protein
MRKGFPAIVSIILLLVTVRCQKAGDAIKIGVAAQMTGAEAKMGNDFKNGITIAVEEWNSRGGVLGKKIYLWVSPSLRQPLHIVVFPFSSQRLFSHSLIR